jgi:hypothetical protein
MGLGRCYDMLCNMLFSMSVCSKDSCEVAVSVMGLNECYNMLNSSTCYPTTL